MPRDAELLAKSTYEPHHCFKLSPHIYGVQFHPEFTEEVMAESIKMAEHKDTIKHLAPEDISRARYGTESGYALLKQFVRICDTINEAS